MHTQGETVPVTARRATSDRDVRAPLRFALEIGAVAVGGTVAGVLSLAVASALPGVAQPLVDAPAGWTLIAALLVWTTRRTAPLLAALLGVVGLVSLNLGWYVLGGGGGSVYAGFWIPVAIMVGPVVGAAAGQLHRRDVRCALGGGVLAGIVLGDAFVSTTLIGNIDSAGGTAMVVVGVLLVGITAVRVRGAAAKSLVLGTAAATAAAYAASWTVLAGVL